VGFPSIKYSTALKRPFVANSIFLKAILHWKSPSSISLLSIFFSIYFFIASFSQTTVSPTILLILIIWTGRVPSHFFLQMGIGQYKKYRHKHQVSIYLLKNHSLCIRLLMVGSNKDFLIHDKVIFLLKPNSLGYFFLIHLVPNSHFLWHRYFQGRD
jgi:hypothetical protein